MIKKLPYLLILFPLLLIAQEPMLPFETEEPGNGRFFKEFLNMLSSLGIILLGLLLLAYIAKRFTTSRLQQMNTTATIKILEQRPISSKSVIYLIEIENTGIVLAEHSQGITKLAEFPLEATPQESVKERNPVTNPYTPG